MSPGAAVPHAQLRLSDAERDDAAQLLGDHFAAGRLSAEEHDERTSAAFAARTRGELPGLFSDLPGGSPWSPAPSDAREPSPVRWTGGPRTSPPSGMPPVLRVLAALVLVVLVLTQLPWILIGLVAFVVLSRKLGRRGGSMSWPGTRCVPLAGGGRR